MPLCSQNENIRCAIIADVFCGEMILIFIYIYDKHWKILILITYCKFIRIWRVAQFSSFSLCSLPQRMWISKAMKRRMIKWWWRKNNDPNLPYYLKYIVTSIHNSRAYTVHHNNGCEMKPSGCDLSVDFQI